MVGPIEVAALTQLADPSSSERKSIRKEAKKERESKDKELKEVHERELGRERDFQNILIRASTAIAEHKTKAEMISRFASGVGNYSEILAKYNQEIANLECVIELMEKELQPYIQQIETLEKEISELLFLYDDKNKTFDKRYGELKLLLQSSEILVEDKASKVIDRKKQELEELEEEITDIEIKALNRELERLNKAIELQPKKDLLNEHQLSLKFLRNEKSNKEMSSLYLMLSSAAKEPAKDSSLDSSSKNHTFIDAKVLDDNETHQTSKPNEALEEKL